MNEAALRKWLNEFSTFAKSRIVHTEEGRHLVAHLARFAEIIVDGAPRTELPPRHHE